MNMYADLIQESFGHAVEITNFMGRYEPGIPPNTPMQDATLLESLRFNQVMRDAVRSADIILIETGGNQLDRLFFTPSLGWDCTGDLLIECIHAMGRQWDANFASILDEIYLLRAGQPTAVRLMSNPNPFIMFPEMIPEDQGDDFALTDGTLIWELLNEANCGAADEHGAQCVDVRPIVNGPSMDEPGRDDTPEVQQVIAEALLATGLPELE
jgi:hypothetical protein